MNDHLDSIAILAKSLADENRLRILLCVTDGKKSVSQPLVSHHLLEVFRHEHIS